MIGFFWMASADSIGDNEADFTLCLTLQNPSTGTVDIGQSAFNQMFWDSEHHILKRECDGCGSEHQVIYYKRITDLTSFDLYTYTFDWESDDNVLGVDFNLYSNLADALAGTTTGAWKYCNYDDNQIGMFRDCGVNGYVPSEWTSRTRGGDAARFYIYTPEVADCGSLPIDAYLSSCSDEFAANELEIESLQSAQTAATERLNVVEADVTANSERMDEFAITADTVEDTIESVQSDYDGLVSRLEEIESWKETVITFSAAKSGPGLAETVGSHNGLVSPDDKNTIIVALVVANMLLIIGCFVAAFTACFGVQRQEGYGKVFPPEN